MVREVEVEVVVVEEEEARDREFGRSITWHTHIALPARGIATVHSSGVHAQTRVMPTELLLSVLCYYHTKQQQHSRPIY